MWLADDAEPDHAMAEISDPPLRIVQPRRGRPPLMNRDLVLERIRQLARSQDGLFRIHVVHADLYARARRQFGSWAAAVRAAGIDYAHSLEAARRRSLETRSRSRRNVGRNSREL